MFRLNGFLWSEIFVSTNHDSQPGDLLTREARYDEMFVFGLLMLIHSNEPNVAVALERSTCRSISGSFKFIAATSAHGVLRIS